MDAARHPARLSQLGPSPRDLRPRRHVQLRATWRLSVCVLDARVLDSLLATQPVATRALMAGFARALRRADERLLGQRSGPQRCAHFMLDIYDRLLRRGMVDGGCPFPLHRRHIAAALGISGTHVARSLAELRDAGLASVANGTLLIHDHARLVALAAYEAVEEPGQATLL